MPNPNSISSRQKTVVDNGFLDLLGSGPDQFKAPSLDAVTATLVELAALYIQKGTDKLNAKDKVSSGYLSDSMIASPVQVLGKTYVVEISLASYYKFVDQGVDGWNQSQGSPYKFKNYQGKSGKKSSPMVEAIKKWLVREGLQGTATGYKPITRRERFQRSITDANTSRAIAITKAIRKKGLAPTHFWSETEKEMLPIATKMFGEAIKIDIINSLS
jgi:hypothetical protein